MNAVEDEDSTSLKLYLGSFLNSVMKGGYFSYLGSFTTPGNHNKAIICLFYHHIPTMWYVAIDQETSDNKMKIITTKGINEYPNNILFIMHF